MNVGQLVVDLVTDASEYTKGLKGAESATESWGGRVGGMASKAIGGVLVGAAAAGVVAVGAIATAAFDVSRQTEQASASIAASLGIPTAEAERFGAVAKAVYGNNFAESVTAAGAAVAEVAKQFQLAADDPSLKRITEQAISLKDTFGTEVNESVSAAKTLMENFGITSDEAFDLITAGYQKGLDRSGDFLDTIGEYSVQFASGGADVTQFFSMLDSGLQGGMLGTDKAADLFKEFRVRIQDGSTLTAESLAMIGLNADTMAAQMADGSLTAAEAFDLVQYSLQEVTDENVRMQAGVGLLGTQFEDLGTQAALGATLTGDAFANVEGASDSLNNKYATLGDAVSGIWRRLVVAVSPFTDKLIELINDKMPAIMAAFDSFEANLGPVISTIGSLINYYQIVIEEGDWLNDHLSELPESMQGVVKATGQVIEWFQNLTKGVGENTDRFSYFKSWIDTNMPLVQELVGKVLGAIQRFWDAHGASIMKIVNNTFENIMLVVDTVLKTVLDLVTFTLQILNGDFEAAGSTLHGIVMRIWDTVGEIIGNQVENIKTLIFDFDWAELGRNIVQGMIDGIVGMSSALWQAADQISQDLWDQMTGWWDVNSPSDKAREGIGQQIGRGLGLGVPEGLDATLGTIDGAMGGLFDGMGAGASGRGGGRGISLVQNFYGNADPAAVRYAAESGITTSLRAQGA
jgi:phage-related protein